MSKPGKSLKALCKKLGVRLTVKRGKKRVYKSVKVLKAQCKRKKKKVKRKRRRRKFGTSVEITDNDDELTEQDLLDYEFSDDEFDGDEFDGDDEYHNRTMDPNISIAEENNSINNNIRVNPLIGSPSIASHVRRRTRRTRDLSRILNNKKTKIFIAMGLLGSAGLGTYLYKKTKNKDKRKNKDKKRKK